MNSSQKILVESLAMDLKRVALGIQRSSTAVVTRFTEEALRREEELQHENLDDYLKKLISRTKEVLKQDKDGEDVLMYSTLLQNFAQHQFPT